MSPARARRTTTPKTVEQTDGETVVLDPGEIHPDDKTVAGPPVEGLPDDDGIPTFVFDSTVGEIRMKALNRTVRTFEIAEKSLDGDIEGLSVLMVRAQVRSEADLKRIRKLPADEYAVFLGEWAAHSRVSLGN